MPHDSHMMSTMKSYGHHALRLVTQRTIHSISNLETSILRGFVKGAKFWDGIVSGF